MPQHPSRQVVRKKRLQQLQRNAGPVTVRVLNSGLSGQPSGKLLLENFKWQRSVINLSVVPHDLGQPVKTPGLKLLLSWF